jgi:hypothetical protein
VPHAYSAPNFYPERNARSATLIDVSMLDPRRVTISQAIAAFPHKA